jgi:hypothetical protein
VKQEKLNLVNPRAKPEIQQKRRKIRKEEKFGKD